MGTLVTSDLTLVIKFHGLAFTLQFCTKQGTRRVPYKNVKRDDKKRD